MKKKNFQLSSNLLPIAVSECEKYQGKKGKSWMRNFNIFNRRTEVFFTLITASFNPFFFLQRMLQEKSVKFILIKNLLSEHWRRFPNWKTSRCCWWRV